SSTEPPTLLALGGAAFGAEPLAYGADASGPADPMPAAAATAAILRGGPWDRGFDPLPGTAVEARSIAALAREALGDAVEPSVLDPRRASRESVVQLAPRARWLHLATHGWFAPESIPAWDSAPVTSRPGGNDGQHVRGMSPMLLCGLAFAGANLPAD